MIIFHFHRMKYFLKFSLFLLTCACLIIGGLTKRKNGILQQPSYTTRTSGNSIADEHCSETRFKFCTINLMYSLNLTKIQKDASIFFLHIVQLLTNNGLAGFRSYCMAINEYIHCLDKTSDSCLSVESLLWLGINRNDAVIYESMVRQMKYQCGAAYQIFYDNYYCAELEIETKAAKIVRCMKSFNVSSDADLCKEVNNFASCYKQFYSDCGQDFTTALCETFKAGYVNRIPRCNIIC